MLSIKISMLTAIWVCYAAAAFTQEASLSGVITAGTKPVAFASVFLGNSRQYATVSDSAGNYTIAHIRPGTYRVTASSTGFTTAGHSITIAADQQAIINIELEELTAGLDEVVVTGTIRPVSKADSPIPIEIFSPRYFQKNPTACLFEAVGMVNGVKPQINCNVCNTGDIHINGMEGPYTLILIDGMPVVSSLSTVYGLSGIPNSLVERLEVVKGPATALYGADAMGGIINVITKNPVAAPLVSADVFGTTLQEYNVDAAVKMGGNKMQGLFGINYFNYQQRYDKNDDGFTDVTLQNRVSVFNKWSAQRRQNRLASLAARFVNEDRWGGQANWSKAWRGSDSIYGESIYTSRVEAIGMYQLPVKEKIITQFSYNWHHQNSWYGRTPFMAVQQVVFAQAYWDKQIGIHHNLLLGATYRYTYYDDNTPGTLSPDGSNNNPSKTPLPGTFIQDEWNLGNYKLLAGYRYDHDKRHGGIHSPRMAVKWSPNNTNTLRASFGTGFRVVSLFTEDHAALTGARQVVIAEALKPERSFNTSLNYVWKVQLPGIRLNIDATGFYSYFTNKIVGDFDSDPDKIIYSNLNGFAISKGISVNAEAAFKFPLTVLAGVTYMNVYEKEKKAGTDKLQKVKQLHAPDWSGNFSVSYLLPKNFSIDLTGQWNGPMRLPVQPDDYRPAYSPWYALMNIQLTRKTNKGFEIYGGIKNLLNFVPKYALMRAFDPFDKTSKDPVTNPHGYSFDTEYNYAPLQGIKGFAGVRYSLFKQVK